MSQQKPSSGPTASATAVQNIPVSLPDGRQLNIQSYNDGRLEFEMQGEYSITGVFSSNNNNTQIVLTPWNQTLAQQAWHQMASRSQ